jgi:hypothetical protein
MSPRKDTRAYRVDVGPFARALKQAALDEDKTPRQLLQEILANDPRIAQKMPKRRRKAR